MLKQKKRRREEDDDGRRTKNKQKRDDDDGFKVSSSSKSAMKRVLELQKPSLLLIAFTGGYFFKAFSNMCKRNAQLENLEVKMEELINRNSALLEMVLNCDRDPSSSS
ncbi:unnamed protein product [Cochlearia groenlandica]